jgi:S1-C subfamily serine protease
MHPSPLIQAAALDSARRPPTPHAPGPSGLRLLVAGAVAVAAALTLGACGSTPAPTPHDEHAVGPRPLEATQIIERARPGIVQIYGKVRYGGEASGTGWVLRAGKDEAIIVTAAHVISSLSNLSVNAGGKATVSAQLLASFPCQGDVAFLKVTDVPEGLRPLPLGSGPGPKAGEPVYTVGYPSTAKPSHSEQASSSQGTISNPLIRNVTGGPDIVRLRSAFIDTIPEAPGYSGGPVINHYGQVVGINLLSNVSNGVQNQNYALPVAEIQRLMPDALKGDSPSWQTDLFPARYFPVRQVVNSAYGIRLWGSIMQRMVNRYGGLVVRDAEPGGPAANAHLKAGDWITHINGTRVNSVTAACDVMQSRSAGDKVEVEGFHLVSGSFARSGNSFTRHVRAP